MLGIWPVFKTMAGLDLAVAGLIAASCALIGEAMQGLFGSLGDRGHQKKLLLGGVSLAACSTAFSYFDSYGAFFCLFLATCIGSAAFHPTAASVLGQLTSGRKNSMMGFFTAAGMLGLGVSQILFTWTYETLEGSTAVLVAPSLFLVAVIFFVLRVPQGEKSAESHGLFPVAVFKQFLKVKTLRVLYVTMIGNQIALWSLAFLLPDFLQSRGFAPWIVYGGGQMFLMLGAAICPPIMGYIADSVPVKPVMASMCVMTLVLFYSLILPVGIHSEMLFPLLFLLGGSLNSISPLVWSLGSQLVPKSRGMISAFLMGAVWIVSESLGLGLSGLLASLFTEDAPAKALACMGMALFVTITVVFRLPKSVEKSVPFYLPTGEV